MRILRFFLNFNKNNLNFIKEIRFVTGRSSFVCASARGFRPEMMSLYMKLYSFCKFLYLINSENFIKY